MIELQKFAGHILERIILSLFLKKILPHFAREVEAYSSFSLHDKRENLWSLAELFLDEIILTKVVVRKAEKASVNR